MKKNYKSISLFIFIFSFLILNSYSQKANIWYFGINAGVDFSSGSPVALSNGALSTYEGCASICDNSGALLFYTDGITVYNSTHNIMQNGTGLFGSVSSTQSALIVPFPGNTDEYYIFTTDYSSGPFSYSVVDMTQSGGLGAVTIKNTVLLTASTEKLTAVKAANGIDYWVVAHESGNALFYAYNVTATGVSVPVVSAVGSAISGLDCLGSMKLNPQGTQLAVTMELSWTYELFDFDNATGVISNGRILGPMSTYTYSCEFSPSGHYLYGNVDPTSNSMLFQFDVTLGTAAAINASKVMVGVGNLIFNFGTLQNGPDGKIYMAREGKDSLAVIINPEAQGMACNFVNQGPSLAGHMGRLGLPNFITSYFDIPTGIATHDNSDQDFLLFPNPVTSESKLTFGNKRNDKMLFNLYDISGRIIECMTTTNNEIIINKGSKSNGVYFFNLVNGQTGELINGKIVIAD